MKTFLDYSIQNIKFGDKSYPKNLSKIKKPPKEIFYRGELSNNILEKTIAIVGTRQVTNYGKQAIDEFVSAFVSQGVTTISGFMYGVDTEVHNKTLEYGGRTISIFGNGLDYVYPPENDKLYLKILENKGIVMSEYEKDMKPQLWTYPARNRIVSALSTIGVLVIEADIDSGSMITAKIAYEQKKNVWAIPGQITSKSSNGTNYLIKKGLAKMATSPADIVSLSKQTEEKIQLKLDGLEAEVYAIIENENLSIDEISMKLGKDIVEISATLTMMAIKGIVNEIGGKYFISKV
ncbi:MAG TPA: DNA-processing protein DprA [Patescibacteria group bacterium]|nr:DNA-processing protein DprA [Patescibacteria group bacterium]